MHDSPLPVKVHNPVTRLLDNRDNSVTPDSDHAVPGRVVAFSQAAVAGPLIGLHKHATMVDPQIVIDWWFIDVVIHDPAAAASALAHFTHQVLEARYLAAHPVADAVCICGHRRLLVHWPEDRPWTRSNSTPPQGSCWGTKVDGHAS